MSSAAAFGMLVTVAVSAQPASADHTGFTQASNNIQFNLEGCRSSAAVFGINGPFICPDPDIGTTNDDDYTNGNLGKSWNELDLVPHRLTTTNSGDTSETYNIVIAADYLDAGTIGYDILSDPVVDTATPGVGTDASDASCQVSTVHGPFNDGPTGGGADQTIYRILEITQGPDSLCVFDYWIRLSLEASDYSGSSLQSYKFELVDPPTGDPTDFSVGKATISIPTKDVEPVEITKDMTATQGADNVWNLTKGATPTEYDFGCTCEDGNEDPSTEVSVTINWSVVEVQGDVKVVTNVYADNTASRTLTFDLVDDELFDGPLVVVGGGGPDPLVFDVSGNSLGTSNEGPQGPFDVPGLTNQLLATFTFDVDVDSSLVGTTWSNKATATVEDPFIGDTIGTVTAVSEATITQGAATNATAVITDVESISDAGGVLSYSVDSFTGATGSFQGGYVAGTSTQADVTWVSDAQSADGSVTFNKTVYLDGPAIVTDGSLSDVASLLASDGFATDDATAETTFTSDAEVELTIDKTITGGVLADGQSETFYFDVFDGPDLVAGDIEITITGPATSGSATVEGLEPGVEYTVSEQDKNYWTEEGDKTITIDLPSCEDSVSFGNVFDPLLQVTKSAEASYTERHDWDVAKAVDPTDQSEFAGNAVGWTWTIDVIETVTDKDFLVTGTIDVFNPMPYAVTAIVEDELDDGTPVAVDCDPITDGNQTSVTIPANSTESCSYSASPDDDTATENTATATTFGQDFTGTADVVFEVNVENDSATVSDTEVGLTDEPVSGGDQFNFTDGDVCSSVQADYGDDGMYMVSIPNTATLVDEEGTVYEDDATTKYTCYAPLVTKDASASFTERHDWDVEKTVSPLSQMGLPGDTLPWTWTIDVTETVVDQDFAVTGTIDVSNPAGAPDSITVSVADALDDGTIAGVDCDGFGATSVTVAPGETESCSYTASPTDASATSNTATGTFNGIDFTGSADVTFVKNVENDSATVSDIEIGLVDEDANNAPFTGDDSVICATDRQTYADLGDGFMYMDTVPNTATLTDSEGTVYQDDATTEWLCTAGFVDLVKTTNGQVDPTKDIRFELYSGITLLETLSTLNDPDGRLEFQTALRPGDSYTICEAPVPAGYTFEIRDADGNVVLTYAGPPGADNPTGEVQCFDFIAAEKATTTYTVDNRFPGGGPRTPGYWKNWNTCSGGHQDETAAKLGGVDEGVFLLDDLLPQIVGDLVVDSCEVGVSVLDSRDINSGKKMASDAGYTLARAYLAALLNQDAGACDPDGVTFDLSAYGEGTELTFQEILNLAQDVLDRNNFDGTGKAIGKRAADKDLALFLYGIIDDYNNGEICNGEPSH